MSMLIRNLRRPQDLQKAILTQEELLKIAIENDANIAEARRAYKLGEPAPLPIEDQRTKEELNRDEALQIKNAQNNLTDLGFKFDEATTIISNLGYNGALIINRTYPSMKNMFLSTYNIKTATPAFFLDWFKQYAKELEASKGLTFSNTSKFNALIKNVNDIKTIMPTKSQVEALGLKLGRVGDHIYKKIGQSKTDIEEVIENLNKSSPADDYYEYLAMNTTENSRILEDFLQATANFPSREDLQKALQANADNQDSLEKIIDMLSGISPESIRELQTVLREMVALAKKPEPVTFKGPPITPTEFEQLKHRDKQSYLSSLTKAGLISSSDGLPSLKSQSQVLNQFYEDIYSMLISKAGGNEKLIRTTSSMETPINSQMTQDDDIAEEDDGDDEEEITGKGIGRAFRLVRKPKRIILGRGLAIAQQEPKYKEFGKYAIHWGQLTNNDILNVKYKSLGSIPSIKPQAISDIFKDFIIDVIETGQVNQRLYNQVPDDEKKIFEKIVVGAGLLNTLKLKKVVIDKDLEEINRFNVLKGEYLAGNTNTQVLKELRRYIVKFISEGRIPRPEGMNLLLELSI
jgi:hypothetical protein